MAHKFKMNCTKCKTPTSISLTDMIREFDYFITTTPWREPVTKLELEMARDLRLDLMGFIKYFEERAQ